MNILVNGEIKELTAVGKNNAEWTQDLLGNYGALSYDEDKDMYTLSTEDYEWWSDIVDKLNKIEEIKGGLTSEELEEYYSEDFNYGDLESDVDAEFNWLLEKKEAKSAEAEKKPSVIGEIGKIKAEQENKKAEKPAPQKAKSHGQEIE
ncbi:MAG: hypothetical protein NC452_05690 [Eubacterium sp.]|nr:hypothetical protein [Eubacterium sp.]